MRTTLTLDDDIAARLQAEAWCSALPFKTLVNNHLRAALAQRQVLKSAPRFTVTTVDLGGPVSGQSYDDIGGLLENIEGAATPLGRSQNID